MFRISAASTRRSLRTFQRNLSFFDRADRNWDKAWKLGLTPWDLKGTVVPALRQAVEESFITPETFRNVLIPGCGSGYECFYMYEKGFKNVIGLDLSTTAIEHAKSLAHQRDIKGVTFQVADFFAYEDKKTHDFIFDYLFFAALDPPLRSNWASAMSRLITPRSGIVATLIFPLRKENDDPSVGPPYPVLLEDYKKCLSPLGFEVLRTVENTKSVKPRQGREVMVYWRKSN